MLTLSRPWTWIFSSVVLAAPTIRAVMRSRGRISSRRPRHGRRARRRTERGKNCSRGCTGSAVKLQRMRDAKSCGRFGAVIGLQADRCLARARVSLSSVSQAIEIAAKWLCALCSAESIMVNDSLSLNSRSVLWKLLQARRIFFEFILAGHLWRRLIRFS